MRQGFLNMAVSQNFLQSLVNMQLPEPSSTQSPKVEKLMPGPHSTSVGSVSGDKAKALVFPESIHGRL